MKKTYKGYEYNGYEINRVISTNMMTLCKEVFGWEVIDMRTRENISPYIFDTRKEAKAFVDRIKAD